MSRLLPHIRKRAYADDLAAVTHSLSSDSKIILRIIREYGDISGLHLNVHKTVAVPLDEYPLEISKDS